MFFRTMMKATYIYSMAIAALLSVQSVAPGMLRAQTTTAPSTETPAQIGVQRKPDPARLEALKAKIEQIKYQKIKTSLEMDDAQSQKFFAMYKPTEKEIQDLVKQRNDAMRTLHDLSTGSKTDAEVDPTLTKIRDLTTQIQQKQVSFDQSLKPILSPRQRARLLVFEQEFNKRILAASTPASRQRFLRNHPAMRKRLQRFRLKRLQQKLKHR
jgi:Spy/CpxP family protein refolding chaperone